MKTTRPATQITWAPLPQDPDDDPCRSPLYDQDDYLIRLVTGEVLWATWDVNHGSRFVRLDDAGECVGEKTGDGISGVVAALVSGYTPSNIAFLLGRPTLTDRVVASVLAGLATARVAS